MPKLRLSARAALILSVAPALAACGESEPKPDPAVIDQHLNQLIAQDEAERRRLVEDARAREDVREQEMKQREANIVANASAPDNGSNAAE